MCIKAQVAEVTRPLAATAEMVDAGNIVINQKGGGIIKQVTEEHLARIMKAIQAEPGLEIPVYRKRNTFLIDMDVPDPVEEAKKGVVEDPEGGFKKPKKTVRARATHMDVDRVGVGEKAWAALWNEDLNCQPCGQAFHGRAM